MKACCDPILIFSFHLEGFYIQTLTFLVLSEADFLSTQGLPFVISIIGLFLLDWSLNFVTIVVFQGSDSHFHFLLFLIAPSAQVYFTDCQQAQLGQEQSFLFLPTVFVDFSKFIIIL